MSPVPRPSYRRRHAAARHMRMVSLPAHVLPGGAAAPLFRHATTGTDRTTKGVEDSLFTAAPSGFRLRTTIDKTNRGDRAADDSVTRGGPSFVPRALLRRATCRVLPQRPAAPPWASETRSHTLLTHLGGRSEQR